MSNYVRRLKAAEVMRRLDIKSKETLRQMWKVRKIIPAPIQDEGGCCHFWLEDEINAYIQAQAAKRQQREPMAA